MKPAWQFILSPLLFSFLGLLMACAIAYFAPTPPLQGPDFERLIFISFPIVGCVAGWVLAYLATPVR